MAETKVIVPKHITTLALRNIRIILLNDTVKC